jgi:hypothetical protein
MMKHLLYNILLTAIILTAAHITGTAQNDSPLYNNVISDDISSPSDTASHRRTPPVAPQANQKVVLDTTSLHAFSNEDLGEQMQTLQRLYLAGKYYEAISLSQSIRENFHLDQDDEADRQKYTIASYKEMEYNEEADSAATHFLGKNPFYKPKSGDPVPFKEIVSNYYTAPKFSIWISVGQVIAIPVIDTVHVITDTITSMKPSYENENSETVQLGFEYHPSKYLSVSVAPTYTVYHFTRSIDRTERSIFHYAESNKILSVPLRVEAYWAHKDHQKWVPSIYLGASAKYILQSTYTAYTETPGKRRYEADEKTHDLDDKTRLNVALLGGARINYNYRRITIFGDLGIAGEIKPFNNPKAAYSNNDLAYDKMYIPDIFHVMELSAMIGIKVNLGYKTIAKYGYGH